MYFGIRKNKVGYTATPVACGWAGAVFEVTIIWAGAVRSMTTKNKIVAKALDGQRYPLPLTECMRV